MHPTYLMNVKKFRYFFINQSNLKKYFNRGWDDKYNLQK